MLCFVEKMSGRIVYDSEEFEDMCVGYQHADRRIVLFFFFFRSCSSSRDERERVGVRHTKNDRMKIILT